MLRRCVDKVKKETNHGNRTTLTILKRFLDNREPTLEEAIEAFTPLTVGDYDDVHIAGAARAFLAAGRPFPVTGEGLMDAAGTGGDGANTINITTAASLVAAAGGVPMVKCGNRSVSSKSGSADVLEALGVSTLFNTMGPLLSPARPEHQIMGIANPAQGQLIAETMRELGRGRALVVHDVGTDELAVHGESQVWELGRDGSITSYVLTPEELGLQRCSLEDLRGGDGVENATAIRATCAGEGPKVHRSAVAAGAGAMFYLNGTAPTIADGVSHALNLLADGTVHAWLQHHEEADYSP
ncbi:anthranilate phosphoribosyltransferase [Corynebacterium sp. NML140438]|nr:anthranilate phosphoribosyltransferase [Corynebacterium sp. NML140438]OIR44243.1 anthranilate phosphoribosyltransferase [Corynebacterium sp. NML140438]